MKKYILLALVVIGTTFLMSTIRNQVISTNKDFSGNNPYFTTDFDTLVTNDSTITTLSDTFTCTVFNARNSATFYVDAVRLSGHGGGTIACWQSASNGTAFKRISTTNIDTNATQPQWQQAIDGNPATTYMVIVSDTGIQHRTVRYGVLVR